MAYQIKCDDNILLDVRDEELIVFNPKVKLEVNTVGEGSFTIYRKHPHYDKIKRLKSVFEVRDEIGAIFRGRMTDDTIDFNNGKAVDLEGLMAFFNDSIIAPFNFPEDFQEDDEYIMASENGNVVEFFLKWLIEQHNSQVQEFQRFKLGVVTVSDPNNYLTRSDTSSQQTWDVLKSKLFDSALGGNLCIRYEDDGNYIDYLAEFTLTNTQRIEFGANLIDLKHETKGSETYSAIIPIGAEIESEADAEGNTTKSKLDLSSIPDGHITDDIVKTTLSNGLHAIYSVSALEEYGWICANPSETTWDDVTDANNLLNKSVEYMTGTAMMLTDTIEVTAVDLHFTDEEIQSFRIYRKVEAISIPHNLSRIYPLTKLEIPLLEPQNTKITLGETVKTLTGQSGKYESETIQRIETAEKDIKENRSTVSEVQNQVIIQSTKILNDSEQIIMEALKSYVETGNFEEYKETVSTQFQLLSDELNIKVTETLQQIENVNGDLQEKFNIITKYFTFDIDGLTVGQVDNPKKIIIDNDDISIVVNEAVVQKFDAEGNALIPSLSITRLLEMLGFLIDKDENGNVNCEYVGGEA